jgi:hypothetical protein
VKAALRETAMGVEKQGLEVVDGAVGPRAALMAACWATGRAAGAKVGMAEVGMAEVGMEMPAEVVETQHRQMKPLLMRPRLMQPRLLLAHLISFDDASGVASH